MHTHTHIYTHTYACTDINTCTHIYIQNTRTCVYIHMHAQIHTFTHTNIHSDINTQTHRASYYGVCARPKDLAEAMGKTRENIT